MKFNEIVGRAWAWLLKGPEVADGSPEEDGETSHALQGPDSSLQAPLCPICKGRPVRGTVHADAFGTEIQWFHAACRCGCGEVRRSVCCPVCCGAGRVTRELIVEHEGLGETALLDYRRAAVGN